VLIRNILYYKNQSQSYFPSLARYHSGMVELRLVGLILGGFVVVPWLMAMAPWEVTFGIGVTLVVLGMAVGVPAGALYHLRLWQTLKPERRWWIHPTALHDQLTGAARSRVLFWFRFGAVGFVIAIAGCVLVGVGVLRS
jgi:hypothetical protein